MWPRTVAGASPLGPYQILSFDLLPLVFDVKTVSASPVVLSIQLSLFKHLIEDHYEWVKRKVSRFI